MGRTDTDVRIGFFDILVKQAIDNRTIDNLQSRQSRQSAILIFPITGIPSWDNGCSKLSHSALLRDLYFISGILNNNHPGIFSVNT